MATAIGHVTDDDLNQVLADQACGCDDDDDDDI
jgi:hypothetical protein